MKKVFFVFALIAFIIISTSTSAFSQCGTTNRAASRPVAASSSDVVGPAANAVDGQIGTYWKPTGTNSAEWVYVDLGSAYKICKVTIKWGRWNAPAAFKLQVTNTDPTQSGVTWSEIANVTDNNPFPSEDDSYVYNNQTITDLNSARYIRLYLPSVSSSDNFWIKELEVFTEAVNTAPSISLTQPASNVAVNANTPIDLRATATDPEGAVTVEFFRDNIKIDDGTLLTGTSYGCTWTPTTPGTYVISAKATDINSATTTSTSITVTVNAVAAGAAWQLAGNNNATTGQEFIGTTTEHPLILKTHSQPRMVITSDGRIGINTTTPPENVELAVNGDVWARAIKVTQSTWADYVFDSSYKLLPLEKVAEFISQHKHLPDVPSAKKVQQEGLNLGDNQAVLLRKIEELTLYLIEQDIKIKQLEAELRLKRK